MRCLARAPAARPRTVDALLADLEAIPTMREPAATAGSARSRHPRRARQRLEIDRFDHSVIRQRG